MTTTKDPSKKWWLTSVPQTNTWSDSNILRFLRHYQNHPVLWNLHDPRYKDFCARQQAYQHIVQLLKLTYVGVEECTKLVEWLKKKYVEEKEIGKPKWEKRPAWFEIIGWMITRILNPEEKDWTLKACKQCCSTESTSGSTRSSDLRACKDRRADRNLRPSCEHYENTPYMDSDRCNLNKIERFAICNDQVNVVILNIGDTVEKYNSDCNCKTDDESVARNPDCDCNSDDVSTAKNTDRDRKAELDDESCSCSCKSNGSDSSDDATSSCDFQKSSSTANSILSVSSVSQVFVKPIPTDNQISSSRASSTIVKDGKKAGIFMDSQLFRGKRISLVDEYTYDDSGELQLVPPRLHLARCCCGSNFYPLQVEL